MEDLRKEVLKEMYEFMSDKTNSYDRHMKEYAYDNAQDCITLARKADSIELLHLAKKMFNRFKYFI